MSQDWNLIALESGIKIGTMVRSYDFAFDNSNYVEGKREIPPMNSMIFPHISHLEPRGRYDDQGIKGTELGPGIVKSYSGVVGKTGVTMTLNYPL